ncbi:MAG: hypothetical protein JST39_24880, partial [Bacteroidetes bacterium]|nr:hypothetical protein [Bacteroidota bacterium]
TAYIAQWKAAENEAAKNLIGRQILEAFNGFIAFNLYHMNKEETLLNAVLWEHYTDQEILGIQQNIISSIPPQILMEESRWMMRAISNTEIIGWLTGLKHNAPAPVFNVFLQMAAEELPGDRLATVRNAVA